MSFAPKFQLLRRKSNGDEKFVMEYVQSGKHLKRFPDIFAMTNVRILDLSYNRIKHVPAEIGGMCNLVVVNMNFNKLQELPAEIGQLMYLMELHLWGNRLTTVPATLSQCQLLEKLDLTDNRIGVLPAELGTLKSLKVFKLQENVTLRFPSQAVANSGNTQAILRYLREHTADNVEEKEMRLSEYTEMNMPNESAFRIDFAHIDVKPAKTEARRADAPGKGSGSQARAPARGRVSAPHAPSPAHGRRRFLVVRRLDDAEGGKRIALPPTMQELLALASTALGVEVVNIRDPKYKAEADIDTLHSGELMLATTNQEETDRFGGPKVWPEPLPAATSSPPPPYDARPDGGAAAAAALRASSRTSLEQRGSADSAASSADAAAAGSPGADRPGTPTDAAARGRHDRREGHSASARPPRAHSSNSESAESGAGAGAGAGVGAGAGAGRAKKVTFASSERRKRPPSSDAAASSGAASSSDAPESPPQPCNLPAPLVPTGAASPGHAIKPASHRRSTSSGEPPRQGVDGGLGSAQQRPTAAPSSPPPADAASAPRSNDAAAVDIDSATTTLHDALKAGWATFDAPEENMKAA